MINLQLLSLNLCNSCIARTCCYSAHLVCVIAHRAELVNGERFHTLTQPHLFEKHRPLAFAFDGNSNDHHRDAANYKSADGKKCV